MYGSPIRPASCFKSRNVAPGVMRSIVAAQQWLVGRDSCSHSAGGWRGSSESVAVVRDATSRWPCVAVSETDRSVSARRLVSRDLIMNASSIRGLNHAFCTVRCLMWLKVSRVRVSGSIA